MKLTYCLAAGLALLAGCEDADGGVDASTSTTDTSDAGALPDTGVCAVEGAPVLYRLDSIFFPDRDHAFEGGVMGHNIDNADYVCRTNDYSGGVDNSLASVLSLIPTFLDGFNIQDEVDGRLACPPNTDSCQRLQLLVRVSRGPDCAVLRLEDPNGYAYADDFVAQVTSEGMFHGTISAFDLDFTIGTMPIHLEVQKVVFTADFVDGRFSNIVLGAAVDRENIRSSMGTLLADLGITDVSIEALEPLLRGYYDIELDGVCVAMSLGILATASPYIP